MAERILLVEDDLRLGSQLVRLLHGAGFDSTWHTDASRVLEGEPRDFALFILDLGLPGASGLDILRYLRVDSDVPVLILSARNDTRDKVQALHLGADDYMTRPFSSEELLERVRARLRRPTLRRDSTLVIDSLRVDLGGRRVWRDEVEVDLTRVEFDLLATLACRPGEAVTRRTLVDRALDPDREGTERTLDIHIHHLRRKLGSHMSLSTVWGVGYRLDVRSEP